MKKNQFSGELAFAVNKYGKEKDFWLNQLSGEITKSTFRYDNIVTLNHTSERRNIPIVITSTVCDQISKICSNQDHRLHMLFIAVLAELLRRYTRNDDILIGTPIYKQDTDSDFINTVLVLRNKMNKDYTFKQLLIDVVRSTVVGAIEHQNYPIEALFHQLNNKDEAEENPLFDIALLLENIQDKQYLANVPFSLLFSFKKNNNSIEGFIEYDSNKFNISTIERIAKHYAHLLELCVTNYDVPICTLDIIAPEDREKITNLFNSTISEYPSQHTIDKVFSEMVNQHPDKVAVIYKDSCITYKELDNISEGLALFLSLQGCSVGDVVGVQTTHAIEMVVALLAILKSGGVYLPINSEFPVERKNYLLRDSNVNILLSNDEDSGFEGTLKVINLKDSNIFKYHGEIAKKHYCLSSAYIMYTSGSTGTPKGVIINHRNVIRLVKNNQFFKFDGKERILQTGALEFDASTFEIWGALLNGGCLILDDKESILNSNDLEGIIKKNGVTTIWMTSALYNQMVDTNIEIFIGLKHLLVGGDKLSPGHINKLIEKDNKIKIINGYGPTENTTFSTTFQIDNCYNENIPIGMPISNSIAYIFDEELNLAPIGLMGELHVGGDGLSNGYLNNPELTADKFITHPLLPGIILYKTGDLACWSGDGNIEFVGRKDHQIKIRGYRIEPGEIENKILSVPGVKDVTVTDRVTKLGEKYLCAYIVSDTEPEQLMIRENLKKNLPDFMIPAYFIQVKSIPLTSNGKIDRRLLPEPELNNLNFVAPRNDIEKKLVAVWSENLGINPDNIGIDSNYFEIGGHSLKATNMVNQIHKELEVRVSLVEIFKRQTIRELAQLIEINKKEKFISIPKAKKKDYYKLSSAQRRMYVLHNMDELQVSYNNPIVLLLEGEVIVEKIKNAFEKIIERHEGLRTSIEIIDSYPVQVIHENVPIEFVEYNNFSSVNAIINEFVKPFDLAKPPLIRIGYKEEDDKFLLFLDIHHIVIDGTSIALLVKEFMDIYTNKELKKISISYVDYSEWQNDNIQKGTFAKQKEYWINKFKDGYPVLSLPYDFQRPLKQSFEGDVIEFTIDKDTTIQLKKLQGENKTMFMVILAVYNIFLSKLSNQEDILIGSPIAGRNHSDLNYVIGMFVNTIVFRNYPFANKKFREFLEELYKTTTEVFDNHEYQFEELINELNINRDTGRSPLFDVAFSFHNEVQPDEIAEIKTQVLRLRPYNTNQIYKQSKFDFLLSGKENIDSLYFTIEYCTKLFKRDTIERFVRYFNAIIHQVVENPEIKIKEIELLSQQEKDLLLNKFNDTSCGYPTGKTLNELFEDQVKLRPDSIAIQYNNNQITYKELNKRADIIANELVSSGVEENEIVGLLTERSIGMITGILGILKAQGAYLPIDASFPVERVNYMLKDSNVKVIVTDKPQLKDEVKEILISNEIIINEVKSNSGKGNIKNIAYVIYTSGSTGRPKGVLVSHKNVVRLLFNDNFQFDFNPRDIWTMFHSYNFDFSVWEMYGALLYGGKLIIVPNFLARDSFIFAKTIENKCVTILNQTPSSFYNLSGIIMQNNIPRLAIRYVIFGGESLSPKKLTDWELRYPYIKLVNMYGITETTVHVTYKEITHKEIESNENNIGRAVPTLKTYVLDKNNNLVPIMVEGEIHVQGEGVARGYLNNPELTNERFIESPFEKQMILYKSGDIGKFNIEGDLIYVGRQDNQVKIRGFRIEINEIERYLLSYKDISDGIIVVKTNQKNESYLCAYIVKRNEIDISKLKEYLLDFLPDYMIPSHFIVLEKVPLTLNNKVDYKKLPDPQNTLMYAKSRPKDITEEKLLSLYANILEVDKEKINVEDDFFEIGGNSLTATQVVLMIHKELNVKLSLIELFRKPSIAELAQIIRNSVKENYLKLKNAERREYYPLSPAQTRLFIIQQLDKKSIAYNMPQIYEIDNNITQNQLDNIFQNLTDRHDSYRTGFKIVSDQVVQYFIRDYTFKIEYYKADNDEELLEIYKKFIRYFELDCPPLLRVAQVKVNGLKNYLLIDMHHIISDAISQNILIKDFKSLLKNEILNKNKIQYKDYAVWINSQENKNNKFEDYWLKQLHGELPVLNLPYDFKRNENYTFAGKRKNLLIEKDLLDKINVLLKDTDTTMNVFFYTILSLLVAKISRTEDLVIGTVIANREHSDIQEVVGFFVNMLAIRFNPKNNKKFIEYLKESTSNIFDAYDNQAYPFDQLINKLNIRRQNNRHPLVDIVYSYSNTSIKSEYEAANKKESSQINQEYTVSHFDLMVDVVQNNNSVIVSIEYQTSLFSENTINEIAKNYRYIIDQILENRELLIDDIQLHHQLSKSEVNKDLYSIEINL